MLELWGSGYVIEYCVSAFLEEQQREREEKAYKIYITDALKCIAENTQRFNGGSAPSVRYIDLIEPKKEFKMTAKEVIAKMRKKLNG